MFSKNELRLHYLLNASISSVYSKQHSLKTSPHTKKHAKEVRDCFLRMFANKAVISQGIRPSKGTLLRRRWHGAEKPSELAVPAELADCSGTWWSADLGDAPSGAPPALQQTRASHGITPGDGDHTKRWPLQAD